MFRWFWFCLCWGLTPQSTIFQSCRDGATASWVINQYFRGVKWDTEKTWMPYGPQHEKTNKVTVRPAKTQISLIICPAWSESLLCAQWVDSEKTWMPYGPQLDKTNKVTVRPAKTQISLVICPAWSESSLCAQWVAKDPPFLHVDSEDSDQIGQMPSLIWVFAGRTCHFVGFVMRRLNWTKNSIHQIFLTLGVMILNYRTWKSASLLKWFSVFNPPVICKPGQPGS